MGKILYYENRKTKKGLTLLETIISLSILVIVSVTTVSIAVYSSNTFKKEEVKQYFSHAVDNIANLYLSYNEADFKTAMNDSFGITLSGDGYVDVTYYLNSRYELLESEAGHSYKMVFDFDTSSLVLGAYTKADKVIYSRSINK